jgi:hypothetical protein
MASSLFGRVRLSKKGEEFLASTLDALRKSGASEEDLTSAESGLTDAVFAEYRTSAWSRVIVPIVSFFMMLIMMGPTFIASIGPSSWKFWNVWGGIEIAFIIYIWFFFAYASFVWKDLLLNFLDRREPRLSSRLIFALFYTLMLLLTICWTTYRLYGRIYPHLLEITIWDLAVLILCGGWVIAIFNIFITFLIYDIYYISNLCEAKNTSFSPA